MVNSSENWGEIKINLFFLNLLKSETSFVKNAFYKKRVLSNFKKGENGPLPGVMV